MFERMPEAAWAGKRVDAWLAALFPACSMALLRRFLADGALTLGGHPCAKGDRVRPGAPYCFAREPAAVELAANAALPLALCFADEALLAVDKPAAMDCQPNAPEERETLANALLARYPELRGIGDGPLTCGILHRIDRDTSGLVLVARSQAVYAALRAQFAEHTVVKRYVALVSGEVRQPLRLENFLAHNPRCPGRMIDATRWRDAKRPMFARSDVRPLRGFRLAGQAVSLLEVTIRTGVTHQIRAQLSLAGHPIVGDRRYGGRQLPDFPRHFLHAAEVTFTHPLSQAPLTLRAPLPPTLAALLPRA